MKINKIIITLILCMNLIIGLTGCATNKNSNDKEVIFNKKDILIEYRGVSSAQTDEGDYLICFYIENNSDKEIEVSLGEVLIDDWNINLSNNMAFVSANSKFLTKSHNSFWMDSEELKEYGVKKITNINCNLLIDELIHDDDGYLSEQIAKSKVNLKASVQLN